MPIYAYRCESCGFAKDVLQKFSDPLLTECPSCGKSSFSKQVTAAGFHLKGSGWYATDFKGGSAAATAPAASEGNSTPAPSTPETPVAKPEAAPAAAASCSTGCACHS